jgi:hypothetical protein
MKDELAEECVRLVLAHQNKPFSPDKRISFEVFHRLAQTCKIQSEFVWLFPTVNPKEQKGDKYLCEVRCLECMRLRDVRMGKTSVIHYFSEFRKWFLNQPYCVESVICPRCEQELEKEKAERLAAERKNWDKIEAEQKQKCTFEVVYKYLNPLFSIKSDMKGALNVFSLICENACSAEIEKKIKSMPYNEFLKTPYWKLISWHCKRKHRFTCLMCNSKENLQTHHKDYKFHGQEHTVWGFQNLICVCDKCHSKHHGKYNEIETEEML